jgi:hypothetical protein
MPRHPPWAAEHRSKKERGMNGPTGSKETAAEPAATGIDAVLEEVRSTRVTAEQMAHDGPSPGADVPRVLAGLISHLAEQVERLGAFLGDPSRSARPTSSPAGDREGPRERTISPPVSDGTDAGEEDISPEDAPAEPRRDPNAEGSGHPNP